MPSIIDFLMGAAPQQQTNAQPQQMTLGQALAASKLSQITPTAQAAAANTGITMDTTPSYPGAGTLTPQQALNFAYTQNTPLDHNGLPINNDTTAMLQALALRYPGRGAYPDLQPPAYNGYGAPSYYKNHPDEEQEKDMIGQSI